MAKELWIEEFLFRGVPPSGPGSDRPVECHAQIGVQAPSQAEDGEYERRISKPLPPLEAKEKFGLSLGDIYERINMALADEVHKLRGEKAEMEAAAEVAATELARVSEERDQLAATIRSAIGMVHPGLGGELPEKNATDEAKS